ncbi:MAG: type II secretion system protein [Patescibacteria group bacterium]
MKINFKRGFTLIELLVVVAIIGILASVVLASLNSARNKGADAAIKAALSNARAQAELFYDTGQTYTGVCAAGGIGNMVLNAAQKLGSLATVEATAQAFVYSLAGTAGTLGDAVCHESAGAWAAAVSLKAPAAASSGWCVDSTGASRESVNTDLPASNYTCDNT